MFSHLLSTSKHNRNTDIEKDALTLHVPAPITLSWSGLTFEINGRTILSNVSGELKSGQLLAVMGPSGALHATSFTEAPLTSSALPGAGKSTFLDVRWAI